MPPTIDAALAAIRHYDRTGTPGDPEHLLPAAQAELTTLQSHLDDRPDETGLHAALADEGAALAAMPTTQPSTFHLRGLDNAIALLPDLDEQARAQ